MAVLEYSIYLSCDVFEIFEILNWMHQKIYLSQLVILNLCNNLECSNKNLVIYPQSYFNGKNCTGLRKNCTGLRKNMVGKFFIWKIGKLGYFE